MRMYKEFGCPRHKVTQHPGFQISPHLPTAKKSPRSQPWTLSFRGPSSEPHSRDVVTLLLRRIVRGGQKKHL